MTTPRISPQYLDWLSTTPIKANILTREAMGLAYCQLPRAEAERLFKDYGGPWSWAENEKSPTGHPEEMVRVRVRGMATTITNLERAKTRRLVTPEHVESDLYEAKFMRRGDADELAAPYPWIETMENPQGREDEIVKVWIPVPAQPATLGRVMEDKPALSNEEIQVLIDHHMVEIQKAAEAITALKERVRALDRQRSTS